METNEHHQELGEYRYTVRARLIMVDGRLVWLEHEIKLANSPLGAETGTDAKCRKQKAEGSGAVSSKQ